jgi:hypothetical protein
MQAILKNYVGKKVVVEGTISSTPWQHPMDGPPMHPKSYYFDIGSSQIVVYLKEDINCKGMLKLEGTVIRLGGERRTGRKETVIEYHIIVDSYECGE